MKIHPRLNKICLFPRTGGGGPATFQANLTKGLLAQGIEVTYDIRDRPFGAVLVVGGTHHLRDLRAVRTDGIPVIQRLNGVNWIHRRKFTGIRHYLRAEYGNFILRTIRKRLIDHIVYQSQFARDLWEHLEGPASVQSSVVYNAVDLDQFSPIGGENPPKDRWRVVLVEGNLMGGYEVGLEHAVGFTERLDELTILPIELVIVGQVPDAIKVRFKSQSNISIQWRGKIPQEQIPEIHRSAHLFFSADLNPACPNAVLEALGCGLPVAGFATGALTELVTQESGQIVSYGGDPWRIEKPDLKGLARAATALLENQPAFRRGARQQAEALFDLNDMVAAYLRVFNELLEI
jgi:glycosyltransferase involved in cell wall biosynthesis